MRIVVVGGGVTGLCTALFLRWRGEGRAEVKVVERQSSLGGKVVTHRDGGFLIEGGPDAFLRTRPDAVELCGALGIENQLVDTDSERRKVYVLADGHLRELPLGLQLVVPTDLRAILRSRVLSPSGRLRVLLEPAIPRRRAATDESLGSLVSRRLGRQYLERIGQPMLGDIYAGDADKLSVQATFPQLATMERDYGGLIRGARAMARERTQIETRPEAKPGGSPFVSLRSGLGSLVDAMAKELGPETFVLGHAVRVIERRKGAAGRDAYRVILDDGAALDADAVVLALPGPPSVPLLHDLAPHLARGVAAIRHLSSVVVSLGFRTDEVGRPLDGYGFLVAARENIGIRGCTWSSAKLPGRAPAGHALVRVFLAGEGREAEAALDDQTLVAQSVEALGRPLRLKGWPVISRVDRWPALQPQYDVGHVERVEALRQACPRGLYLAGASYDGVGLPDRVRTSRHLAGKILAEFGSTT